MDNLLLSDEMLRQQICTLCSNYLSVGPVLVSHEREIICGRCSNKSHTGYTRSLFNLIAEKLVFKCINWYMGCNELLLFNEAIDHEKKCKKATLECPFQDFEGNGCQLIHHVRTKHQNVMMGDTFKIIFEQPLMKNVILAKNGSIFCLLINVIDKFIEIYSWLLTPGNRGPEHFKLRFFKSDSNVEYVSPIIKITPELGNFVKLDTNSYQVKNRFVLDQASLVQCFSSTWSMCKVELIDGDCDMERTILEKLYLMKIIDEKETKLPSNVSETSVAKDASVKDLCPKHPTVCENGLDANTSKSKVPGSWISNPNLHIAHQHKWYGQCGNASGAQYGDECGAQYDDQDNDQRGVQYDNQYEDECGAQYDYPYNNQCDDQYGAQYDDHHDNQYDDQCGVQYDDQCDVQYDDQYNDQCDVQYDNQYSDQCEDQYNNQCDDQYNDQCDDQYNVQCDDQYNDQHIDQCDVQYDDQYHDQCDNQHNVQCDDHYNDQHIDQCDVQYDDQYQDQYDDQHDNQDDGQCDVQYDDQYNDQYVDYNQYDDQCCAQYDDQYGDQYVDYYA